MFTFSPLPTFFSPIEPVASTLKQPASIGSLFTNSPIGAKSMDLGSAVSGAAGGAATGGAIGGPIGAAVGAGVGLLDGIFGAKSSPGSGGGGLTEALKLGLGSIIPGKGGSGPTTITQSQTVGQNTEVNVSNVLGGRTFGNVDEAGNFDTFQALADVFAIKDAISKQQAGTVTPSYTTPAILQESKKMDFKPLLIAGGALLAVYVLTKGGKK